jgi:hypothetical protein
MTGLQLHAELARTAPDQAARMIFITGGAFDLKLLVAAIHERLAPEATPSR